MAKSIKVSENGKRFLNEKLREKKWFLTELASFSEVSRQTVSKLYNGHTVDLETLRLVCKALQIKPEAVEVHSSDKEIGKIDIETIRELVTPEIKQRCGVMRILDMERPVGIGKIFTEVTVLDRLTATQWHSAEDLKTLKGQAKNGSTSISTDRLGIQDLHKVRIPALEAVRQNQALMILGKPGSGKTTFLKYLAVSYLSHDSTEDDIPIFIDLREFSETKGQPTLLDFIAQRWSDLGISNSKRTLIEVLKFGRAFLLLDGLDEVRERNKNRIIYELENLCGRFEKSKIIVTCRIAAKEYIFERFVEVEIADFGELEIQLFIQGWFAVKGKDKEADVILEQLEEDESLGELASNPLLLTLLCLVFEETGELPSNRFLLYEEGVDIFLKKWDGKRNIQRDVVYKKLSSKRKENLLGQLAFSTFMRGDYFFDKRVAQKEIVRYVRNLPGVHKDIDELQGDGERILKSIEEQHGLLVEQARGVYSFSHLTFHEYFTAKEISNRQEWSVLFRNLTDQSWREVLFLTASCLSNANSLILSLKEQIDLSVSGDSKIQDLLVWVNAKAKGIEAPYARVTIIFYYLDLILNADTDLGKACNRFSSDVLEYSLTLDDKLIQVLFCALRLTKDCSAHNIFARKDELARVQEHTLSLDYTLYISLTLAVSNAYAMKAFSFAKDLKEQQQSLQLYRELGSFKERQVWWKQNGNLWIERFRKLAIRNRNIGHDWHFTDGQKQQLGEYRDRSSILMECLSSDCYVSREVRQEISDTLFLPTAEIERYKDERS